MKELTDVFNADFTEIDKQKFAESLKYWEAKIEPLLEDIRKCEQLTADDFAVTITI